MHILVTNDDGIDSPGIAALVQALKKVGDVSVVAPDRQQSAVGHALTVASPLRATPVRRNGSLFGWAINGTPADSVKLGIMALLEDRPDIVVSGINHGSNVSVNAIYSGTVSAATEGTLMGVPSMAISLDDFSHDADFTLAAQAAEYIARKLPTLALPEGTLLNVNVPAIAPSQCKGIRIARQGHAVWNDGYECRTDPHGREYYWLKGNLETVTPLEDGDDYLVSQGYIAVVPIHYELTNHAALDGLRSHFSNTVLNESANTFNTL